MQKWFETFFLRAVMGWVVVSLITGVATHPLIAATYYVNANTGDDSRNASDAQNQGTPWKTLTRALDESALVDGDVIQVAPGTYDSAAGEAFPIAPVDGVSIMGAGSQQTIVDAGASNAFEVGGDYPNGVWIGDMTIQTDRNAFSLDSDNAKFTLDGLEILAARDGVSAHGGGDDTSLYATVSNSTVNAGSIGFLFGDSSAMAAQLDLTVDNTTFTGGGAAIGFWFSYVDDVTNRVQINDSTFHELSDGLWGWVYEADYNVTSDVTVSNSTFSNINWSPISLSVSTVSSANTVDWSVAVLDSEFTQTGKIDLDAWYLYDTTVNLDYTVSGNTFAQVDDTAVSMSVTSFSSADTDISVRVEDNSFADISGDAAYYYEAHGYYGNQNTDITMRGNTINGADSVALEASFYRLCDFDSKSMDLKFVDNEVSDAGDVGIGILSEYLDDGGALRHNVTVAGNTVTGSRNDGITIFVSENNFNTSLDFDWTVVNNTVTGSPDYGINVSTSSLGYADSGSGNFTVAGNTVDGARFNGLFVQIPVWYDSPMGQAVTIGGNTVTNAGSYGTYLGLTDQSNLTSNLVRVEDNKVTGCGSSGIYLQTSDYQDGTHITVSGNTVTDNDGEGLRLSGTTDRGNFVPFDLGGGSLGSPGHNTFLDNGTYAIRVGSYDSAEDAILAHDNYFGTTDSSEIESLVYDQADDASYEALDVGTPLSDQPATYGADVALTSETVQEAGSEGITPGDVVRVTATLTGTGEIGCRTAWFVATVPDNVAVVPGSAATNLGAVLDYDVDGLNVAVGYVPITFPVTVSWSVLVEPDDACGDLVFDASLTCTGDSGDIEVPAELSIARLQGTVYADRDGDGYGNDATGTFVCGPVPEDMAAVGGDCNDQAATVNPGAEETCNAVDDDCDGDIDEGVTSTFYVDVDGDGYGDPTSPIQACIEGSGIVSNLDDCDDTSATSYPGAAEVCDEADNDCDGEVDEGVTSTFYMDRDEDGYGDPESPVQACGPTLGISDDNSDCNDRREDIHDGALEVCDGMDNDCDGEVDEDTGNTYYTDQDGDGYGDEASTTVACSTPEGYADLPGDCADNDATINPDATEQCDGIDNDCDGAIDEDTGDLYYLDSDGDGYGSADSSMLACDTPDGYVAQAGDCNDSDPDTNPDAAEVCDGQDNDCDGTVDEDATAVFYADNDGDGYGSVSDVITGCEAPAGYTDNASDCDDTDASVHPGADEVCDGVDNDCNGETDEGLEEIFFLDDDGDGHGSPSDVVTACEPPSGYTDNDDDCDDGDAAVYPGADEVCDGVDNNCDGEVDEDLTAVFYVDGDGDGYGVSDDTVTACDAPDGYATEAGDCDDSNADINPGAEEVCDDLDNDCNGEIDEVDGCAEAAPTTPPVGELGGGGCNSTGRGNGSDTAALAGLAFLGVLLRRRKKSNRHGTRAQRRTLG